MNHRGWLTQDFYQVSLTLPRNCRAITFEITPPFFYIKHLQPCHICHYNVTFTGDKRKRKLDRYKAEKMDNNDKIPTLYT